MRAAPIRSAIAWARVNAVAVASLAVVAAAAISIVAAQPVQSPYWISADADATYTAAGLQIARGHHTHYLDHPGLPIEEGLALAFDAEWLADRAIGGPTHARFVDSRLVHLDATRTTYRPIAIAFYIAGALLLCAIVAALLE